MSISNFIISLPAVKVFAMTDVNNHPFVLSFHYEKTGYNLYFQITPNHNNPMTKVPVYNGTCHTINTFMDMLTTYGCKYIKRLPTESGEVLSRDYLDGLADGATTTKPITATPNSTSHSDDDNEDEWLYDFIGELLDDDLFDEVDESDLPF